MPMRVVTFKADEGFLERLDRVSRILGVNRSDLIRQAIMKIVSSLDNGKTIVCLELTPEELLYLSLIARDPVVALKKLLRQNMVHSSWFKLAKEVVKR